MVSFFFWRCVPVGTFFAAPNAKIDPSIYLSAICSSFSRVGGGGGMSKGIEYII
jgi:hypothetical protein